MFINSNMFNKPELTYWDNEGEGTGDAAADATADATVAATPAAIPETPATPDKTFTQEQVNKIVGERVQKLNAQLETAVGNYEDTLKTATLTSEQRDKVSKDLQRVKEELQTKEQRLEEEKKKAEAKHTEALEIITAEAQRYKGLYEDSTISRAITDAANAHDGFQASQFIAHLAPTSKMVDEVDSAGELTGKLVPKVEWTTVDKETGAVTVTILSPDEAVQAMKENVVDFGNMFRTNVAAGIGQGTAPGQVVATGTIDQTRITTEEYMELAKDEKTHAKMLGKT